MKKYRVKVNGRLFEVELEEVESNDKKIETSTKKEVKVETKVSEVNKSVNAPIGGKVLDVRFKVNDTIKKGDLVCLVEAMKMENEVLSSVDGVVKEVRVSKGAQVAKGEVLLVVE